MITEFIFKQKRMIFSMVFMASLLGIYNWFNMPRQEDPKLRDYWASIAVIYPGSDVESMERLVVDPLEERLSEVEDLRHVDTQIQAEQVYIHLELLDSVKNVEEAWDDVREAIKKAQYDFPEEVLEPVLNTHLNDQESIVLAFTGSDLLNMRHQAKEFKKKLLRLHEVAGVKLIADPGVQVTIRLKESFVNQSGLSPESLAALIQGSNTKFPGGKLVLQDKMIQLSPHSEFESLDEIISMPIPLRSGNTVPLSELANISITPRDPARNLMRFDGLPAIGLGIIPREGIHLLDFGRAVRNLVERGPIDAIQIHEVTYQPDRVQKRLRNLGQSLGLGILIVALVLLLFMGLRLGLVVASIVPLVTFSSLALFAAGGGTLNQISIAALVIALGMLVDNAIVIAENIQTRIDQGVPASQASRLTISELAVPLASATGTTLAAFVPMLLSQGVTAEFTRSLPSVIMLTLTVSYLFAIGVTPAVSRIFLRKSKETDSQPRFTKLSKWISGITLKHPLAWISVGAILVSTSLVAIPSIPKQFFPSSDRNQLILELKLQDGTDLQATETVVRKIEEHFKRDPRVQSFASFIGRSAPHFYYNVSQIPWRPHFAQILLTTTTLEEVDNLVTEIQTLKDQYPEVVFIARKLEQGPPVESPVELRVFGDDPAKLAVAGDQVLKVLREVDGVRDARHDLSRGNANIDLNINEFRASKLGLTRTQVAQILFGRIQGIPAGYYRAQDDPVPILVRGEEGRYLPPDQLEAIQVTGPNRQTVPLGQIASTQLTWVPSSRTHRDGRLMVKVLSQLDPGRTFSEVEPGIKKGLSQLSLPEGVTYEFGGQAEGSSEANSNMMDALPWGMLLLLAILLVEFNSFRKVLLILLTVPLAAAGVVPGLIISGHPFGFMSFLGVVALIGVVVNNAIVLVDVMDQSLKEGTGINEAIRNAISLRTRPIFLTTLTTVAGLLPLALSNSTLWPPLAWPMISGLLASTILTLGIVPVIYKWLTGFQLITSRNIDKERSQS